MNWTRQRPWRTSAACAAMTDAIAKAFAAVTSSIDRGLPVILSGKEAGLIVGYCADGRRILRPYEHEKDGYVDTGDTPGVDAAAPGVSLDAVIAGDWAWGVALVEPHEVPMDRRMAVAHSLRLAVTLARTPRFGEYLSGFAALEHWIEALLDDSRFATLTPENWFPIAHGNGYCYPCLWSARFNAEKYLREVRSLFDEPIGSQLLDLAGLYQQMHQALSRTKPEFDCIWSLQPWMLKSPANWTRAIRQKESDLLREACDIEREAIPRIESLLGLMEPSPAS